jgi:hypothetical protein
VPIAIINVGETRADKENVIKVEQPVGEILKVVVESLSKNKL